MNSVRPLVFLFVRSFINGIKRSLSSPKRAVGLVIFCVYYYFLIIRSFVPTSSYSMPMPVTNRFEMPDLNVVSGILFVVFAIPSLFLMSGIFAMRGGFRPPDVDVLFPTPVSSKVVLIFRMIRDYLITLIAPLFFGVLGWRGTSVGLTALIHNYPVHSMDMLRATWIGWMLMSLGWISLSYGASLFVGRSDLVSDRNQKVINFTIFGVVVGAITYVGLALKQDLSWHTALSLSHSLVLQVIFLPATLATDLAMGSLQGNFLLIGIALGGLVSIIGLGAALAMTQVGWLYDQAAAKGFSGTATRKMRRTADHYGMAAERARKGKTGRMVISKRIAQFTTTGPMALVWKDQLLQVRGPMNGFLITLVGIIAAYGGLSYLILNNGSEHGFQLFALIAPCASAYFLGTINGFGGFVEMLKKVDVLKPLPFTPGRIVFHEVLSKVPVPGSILLAASLELCIIRPSSASSAFGGLLMGIGLLMVITVAILLAVVLFPDYEDPTQRGMSAFVMLLGIVICSTPGLGLYALLYQGAGLPAFLAAIPSAGVLLGVTVGIAYLSGLIYADYNPSE